MRLGPLHGGADEVLPAILDPLDWRRELHGDPGDRLFAVELRLGPEAAADIRRSDQPDLVLGHPIQDREHLADVVRCLSGIPYGELPGGGLEAGCDSSPLHRVAAAAGDHEGLGHDVRGGQQRGIRVPGSLHDVHGHVAVGSRMDQGRAWRQGEAMAGSGS